MLAETLDDQRVQAPVAFFRVDRLLVGDHELTGAAALVSGDPIFQSSVVRFAETFPLK